MMKKITLLFILTVLCSFARANTNEKAGYSVAATVDSSFCDCTLNSETDHINIITGATIHTEDDTTKNAGISLKRYYNSQAKSPWQFGYRQSLRMIDALHVQGIMAKSTAWNTQEKACENGWDQIKKTVNPLWGATTATLNGERCEIKNNGVIVRSLLVIDENTEPGIITSGVQLVRENGSVITYQVNATNTLTSLTGDKGHLQHEPQNNTWIYLTPDHQIEIYAADGKLLSVTDINGLKQTLTYTPVSGLLMQVSDASGQKINFTYAGTQLKTATLDNNDTIIYQYNDIGLLTRVTHSNKLTRTYHYDDARFPTFLTGITDETGKRFITWTYDAQGRATSSTYANDSNKTQLVFNADGSSTTTNALQRKTIYHFADIAGTRRVVAVDGQATANCLGANKNYTYTPEGWLASKTDWNGIKTSYAYNTHGEEISRTEADGTAEARSIKTEWDFILHRKIKIMEADAETIFQYNSDGILQSKTTRALTSNQ